VDAVEKTKAVQRVFLNKDLLVPNKNNPNEMTDAEFNMLADNIEKTGLTDPLLVRPIEDGKYRIVGGHHRFEVAKILGFEEVPCNIITDPNFDDDAEAFQVVRMNVIRGHMSPEKFMKMYEGLSAKYADDIMRESFGFADEDEFRKLVKQVAATLPPEQKKEFEKAAKELKTIDGITTLLNTLFTKYGDTVPHGYMIVDYGGKESVWVRVDNKTKTALLEVGKMCVTENRCMDDILGGIVRAIAKGEFAEKVLQLIAESKPVKIPEGVTMPTEDNISGAQ
jgi:hypothetical protein